MPRKRKILKTLRKKKFSAAFLISIFIVGAFSGGGLFYFADRILPRLLTSRAQEELLKFIENADSASLKIVAVSSGAQPSGVAATLATKIEEGRGYVYVSIDPLLVGFDFQDANRKAINYAGGYVGRSIDADNVGLAGLDVYFIVVGPGGSINIESIDGPSAGAAATIALLAILENKRINSDYAITGTIEENGSIGEVGGIYYKAQAARDAGAKYFLVPPG